MASQAKISSFFKATKSNPTAAAAKRQKAIISETEGSTELLKDSVTLRKLEETPCFKVEPDVPKIDFIKTEFSKIENLKEIFTENAELKPVVQKKIAERKSSRTTKSTKETLKSRLQKLSAEKDCVNEVVKEETTSLKDTHDFIPTETLTPKALAGSTASTRKRKLQSAAEQLELTKSTPEKVEPTKSDMRTPIKVRKRLELGDSKTSTELAETEIKSNIDVSSPSKQVQFLCMGALSPRKAILSSPLKQLKSPVRENSKILSSAEKRKQNLAEKGFKSAAVKSLASLLDKAPPVKMTPEEIKAKLGNSRNLAELRAKLSKVNDCSTKVKEFYEKQVQLKKFDTLEVAVPVSPSKVQSPIKRDKPVERPPAFERFHALAQPPSTHLVLPYKYKVLNEVFRCLETVVAMLFNRKECIYFNKLKPAVQKMLQRDFTEKHFAQVSHVFPSAYKVTYEKLAIMQQGSPVKNRGYQLVITPRINYLSPKLLDEENGDEPNEDQKSFTPLAPSMLIERRYIFHNRLIKIAKEHHTEFLAEYNPLLRVPEDKVTRWHQNFDVDGVPDVPAATLPIPPEVKTFVTAKDVLEQAHNLVKVNPRLEAALKQRAAVAQDSKLSKSEPVPVKEPEKPLAPANNAVNAGLKGVSQSLIDKIRAREAAKAQKQMTMNSDEIRRQSMSKVLPELARIINSVYVTEKKSILPLKTLVERVQYSHKGAMSASSIEEHIKLIRSVYPEWMEIMNRAGIDYIKIDRKLDSNVVYQKLEDNANR